MEASGYRFSVEGDAIRGRRVFQASAPEEEIRRLLGLLKARKAEALAYLKARDGPHPNDCVCADCLQQHFFRPAPAPHPAEPAREAEGCAVKFVTVMGCRVRAYPTRRECMDAGGCLWLTMAGCNLFKMADAEGMTGWCRERINAVVWKTLPEEVNFRDG